VISFTLKYILLFSSVISISSCLLNPHDKDDFDNFYNESVSLESNLMFYHFNEAGYPGTTGDVIDAAGNGNHSDSLGNPLQAEGIYGQGIYCDGTQSGVNITPAIFDNAFSERTISVWFRAETTEGIQYIYEEGGTVNGIVIYIQDGTLYGGTYKANGGDYNIYIPFNVETNKWFHVVITFHTANGFNLFINGNHVDGPYPLGLDMPNHSNDNGLCFQNDDSRRHTGVDNRAGGQFNFFKGVLDEVGVWNRTLTDSEILNLYHRQGRL
jgi:hypothetical protein